MIKKIMAIAAIALVSGTTIIPSFADTTVTLEGNTTEQVQPKAQYGEITANNVNFRKTPNGTIIRQLHRGYQVSIPYEPEVTAGGIKWTKVIYNGTGGWVASQYVREYSR